MAAAYRTSAAGGSSSGTSNRTVAITPAVGDLLIIYCIVAANTNDTPTCSDNNGSGTYDRIDVMNANIGGIDYRLSVFIRTALMVNTTSTTVTVATGSNTSGAVHAIAVSGMSRTGSNAVRSKGSQNNQAAGTAAPALNQSALTGNLTIVAHGSADTTTSAPTDWSERQDTNFSNDTVALETATRDSGFTGTTITFGAASSTVFCSHALELDNSTLFTRTAAIDGVGAVVSAATFFTVFTRTSLLDGAGTIATAGQRALLRSASVGASGSVVSASTFFSVFNGSAAIDGSASIASASSFFSIFNASALVNGTAAVDASATFFSVFSVSASIDAASGIDTSAGFFTTFNRSISIDVSSGIETSATSLTIFDRSTAFDATGSVESSGIFFSVTSSAGLIDGLGAIESTGETESNTGEFERSAVLVVDGQITSSGLGVLERSSAIAAAVTASVSGEFFSTLEVQAEITTIAACETAGQRDLLRACGVQGQGQIATQSTFIHYHEAAVTFEGIGLIAVSGGLVADLYPRKVFNSNTETRILAVSSEGRTTRVPSDRQSAAL